MKKKKKNLCKKCACYHHFRLNLFKTDKAHPRVYFISCAKAPAPGGIVEECIMFRKKKLKHRLGMRL